MNTAVRNVVLPQYEMWYPWLFKGRPNQTWGWISFFGTVLYYWTAPL